MAGLTGSLEEKYQDEFLRMREIASEIGKGYPELGKELEKAINFLGTTPPDLKECVLSLEGMVVLMENFSDFIGDSVRGPTNANEKAHIKAQQLLTDFIGFYGLIVEEATIPFPELYRKLEAIMEITEQEQPCYELTRGIFEQRRLQTLLANRRDRLDRSGAQPTGSIIPIGSRRSSSSDGSPGR